VPWWGMTYGTSPDAPRWPVCPGATTFSLLGTSTDNFITRARPARCDLQLGDGRPGLFLDVSDPDVQSSLHRSAGGTGAVEPVGGIGVRVLEADAVHHEVLRAATVGRHRLEFLDVAHHDVRRAEAHVPPVASRSGDGGHRPQGGQNGRADHG